jgi:hypothetical protein
VRFPFALHNRQLTLVELELFLKFKRGVIHPIVANLLSVFVRSPDTDPAVDTGSLPGGAFSSLANQYRGLPHLPGIALAKDLLGSWRLEIRKPDVQTLLPTLKRVVSDSNTAAQPLTALGDVLEDVYVVCHYVAEIWWCEADARVLHSDLRNSTGSRFSAPVRCRANSLS